MQKLLFLILIGVLVISCKKEPTSWDTSISAPILKSNLGIGDLIADSLLEIGDDQTVAIRINENIFNFGIDSLIDIEPDTVSKVFSIAPIPEFTFNPGQTFYNSDETFEFAGIEAQLSNAILKSGSLYLKAENTIESNLDFILNIPRAIKDGHSLSISASIPPSTISGNGILEIEVDMADYSLDLSGIDGNSYNILEVEFTLTNPIENDPITVINTDFVNLFLSYSELDVSYALGYFGSELLDLNEASSFSVLEDYRESVLDLSSVEADLIFSNGFGVDIQASIYQLKAFNAYSERMVTLENSLIGSTINLSRAIDNGGTVTPFLKTISLNSTNSNIADFIEIIPDSIKILANADLNPFGNISNYNDFLSAESSLRCDVDIRIPLQLSLSNLILNDTTDITWPTDESFQVNSGVLYLKAENSFPAELSLQLIALDGNNNALLDLNTYLSDSQGTIGGSPDHLPILSLLKYTLDENAIEQMEKAEKIAIRASFETAAYPQEVNFYQEDSLRLLISTDINSKITF